MGVARKQRAQMGIAREFGRQATSLEDASLTHIARPFESFGVHKKGIFAAGDICSYPGKLKLILSGFHEVALASVECFKRARPNEKYRFEFTTSSKTIQDRLGKK